MNATASAREHVRVSDNAAQAVAAILARPLRSALTTMGTVLGVAALVAALGVTTTTRVQISSAFDAFAATEALIEDVPAEDAVAAEMHPDSAFPDDIEGRLRQLPGAREFGLTWTIETHGSGVRARWSQSADTNASSPLFAADPGAISVFEPHLLRGRTFDEFHERRALPVIVLGEALANVLSVSDVDRRTTVFVGDRPFTAIGIYDAVRRHPDLLLGAIVPLNTAIAYWGTSASSSRQLVIETRPGAASVIADQAPTALRPDDPSALHGVAPPDPRSLRNSVDEKVSRLFVGLAAVLMAVGAFGIANTVLVSVLERVPEIGLRRAVGARRRDIAFQFMFETVALGALGGLIGAAIGMMTVAVIALANGWTAAVEPLAVLPTPLLGAATGLIAGIYPAARAARIQPADALRR